MSGKTKIKGEYPLYINLLLDSLGVLVGAPGDSGRSQDWPKVVNAALHARTGLVEQSVICCKSV